MKKIVFKNHDGSIGIITPSPSWKGTLKELADKDVPKGLMWEIIESDNIPDDRTFRDAWALSDNGVDVDMDKARDIHMNTIREKRQEKFIELGFPNKLNENIEKSIIPQETIDILEDLRNIPQIFDLSCANTPDELKQLIPDILKE